MHENGLWLLMMFYKCGTIITSVGIVRWPVTVIPQVYFLTPRAEVNHIHLRTSSSTCAHGVLRANIDMVDVRTWSQKINRRDDRNRPP